MDEVEALAKAMAAQSPLFHWRYIIRSNQSRGWTSHRRQGLRLEADLYFLTAHDGDRTEGIKASQQKRTPEFKGRNSFYVEMSDF